MIFLATRISSTTARQARFIRQLTRTKSTQSSDPGLANRHFRIAIVGAGPSGFYAATRLLSLPNSQNIKVDIFESLPVPFGLARFGVAPDHPEVKNCEHKFEETAQDPRFRFFGNVSLSSPASTAAPSLSPSIQASLSTLRPHYDALLLTYGASRSRSLGIPDEHSLLNVMPARDFVAWYNGHPTILSSPTHSHSPLKPSGLPTVSPPPPVDLSKVTDVTVVGQGNVALDIARLLLKPVSELSSTDLPEPVLAELARSTVKRVKVVGRRGPLQLAATTKEVREMMNLPGVVYRPPLGDLLMESMGIWEKNKDMRGGRAKKRILDVLLKGSKTKLVPGYDGKEWEFDFFKSPLELISDGATRKAISGIKWGINDLLPPLDGSTDPADFVARPTGETVIDETDLLFSSVGYKSIDLEDEDIPFDSRKGVVLNVDGRVVNSVGERIPGLYTSGWLSTGPTGVIATTMFNAFATADLIASDLSALPALQTADPRPKLSIRELEKGGQVVTWRDWEKIDKHERTRGEEMGKVREKITSVAEMLKVAAGSA
ncbi:nucleotide-binding domain-containing protein [Meredithblackwellia eburnea MCA 4105]